MTTTFQITRTAAAQLCTDLRKIAASLHDVRWQMLNSEFNHQLDEGMVEAILLDIEAQTKLALDNLNK